MRGAIPKPRAIKEKTGNPGKRPLDGNSPEPRKTTAQPPPRGQFGRDGRRVWKALVDELDKTMGGLANTDLPAFELMCFHYEMAVECRRVIREEGLLRKDDKGISRKHPLTQVFRENSQAFRQFASEFGLLPAGRERLSSTTDALEPISVLLQRSVDGKNFDE